jgi:hypothetical protein
VDVLRDVAVVALERGVDETAMAAAGIMAA